MAEPALARLAADRGAPRARPRAGVRTIQLLHPDLEQVIDGWLAERGFAWQQLERGEIEVGGAPVNALQLQILHVHADPVLWAECYLVERDDASGRPWRLWEYQKPSARYRGNTIHECGAEVGKTREIVLLTLWLLMGNGPRQRGGILLAAAMDGHLDSIYDEILYQLKATSFLDLQVNWDETKVKPYKKLVAKNGNRCDLRPGGFDGEAFRGIHAGLAILGDEVAKWANPKIFSEFFRAALPTAEARLYSTPDGNRAGRFFALCQAAPLAEQALAGRAVGELAPAATEERRFVRFRWSKPQMPPPFWTEARRRGYIEQYGGVDSPGYQQNVLGNWGDAVNSVWPWEQFEPCCRYLADYVEARVLWNDAERAFYVEAYRLNPGFEISARLGDEESRGPEPLLRLRDEIFPAGNFDLEALFRALFTRPRGHLVAGIDCGSTDDPTEVLFFEPLGRDRRCVARVQLKRFTYPEQVRALAALDRIFEPSHGYGLDATGVGTALEHQLVEGLGAWSLDGRLSGYVMNAKTVDLNPETGEPARDPQTDKERKVSNKELSTRLLELGVQKREWQFPRSPDFLQQFPNHTARKGPSGERIFDRTNDHLIDATRVAALRLFEMDQGFADVPIEYATPRGSRRPSLGD